MFCKTGNNGQKAMVLKIHTWNICTFNVVTHFYISAVSKMRANMSGFGALIAFLFCARSVNKRSSRYNNNVQLRDYALTIFIIMCCNAIQSYHIILPHYYDYRDYITMLKNFYVAVCSTQAKLMPAQPWTAKKAQNLKVVRLLEFIYVFTLHVIAW